MKGLRRRSRALVFGLLAIGVAIAICTGCGAGGPRSVILISIDTLRADHLGCYGYHRDTSPAIDALSRDSVRFSDAFSHAPSTLPAHSSLFTSLLPQHHGASVARALPLPEQVLTLAEVLSGAGYRTGAFTGGGQLNSAFGVAQGFEDYSQAVVDLSSTLEDVAGWLDSVAGEPFFLFLHTYEVHHPYTPEPELLRQFAPDYTGELPSSISIELIAQINEGEVEIDDEDLDFIASAYDGEIRAMDRSIGRLVEELRSRDLYEDSLIILTSDHGEEFGEHGWVGWHSHTLYDELLRVPLLFKMPGNRSAGETVRSPARLIDVAPTITEMLGLPTPPVFDGSDLFGDRSRAEEPIVAKIDLRYATAEALRRRQWKWFGGRLFDLQSDPEELTDLASTEPELAAQLEAQLRQLVDRREAPSAEAITPDEETLRQLRALGYVQ